VSGGTSVAIHHPLNRVAQRFDPETLGMNPEGRNPATWRMVPPSVVADKITTGIAGYCERR